MRRILITGAVLLAGGVAAFAAAPIELTLKDHKFTPSEIRVKARVPFVISLTNLDPQAEEFDSPDLKVEKVVAGKGHGNIRIRALAPGRYTFAGEFFGKGKGVVIAE